MHWKIVCVSQFEPCSLARGWSLWGLWLGGKKPWSLLFFSVAYADLCPREQWKWLGMIILQIDVGWENLTLCPHLWRRIHQLVHVLCWTMFMLLIVHIFQCPCSLWFWKVPYVAPLWWKEIVSLLPNVRVEENIDKVVYACFIWSLYCYESIGTSHRFALTSLLSFENVKESFLLVVL